MVRTSSVHLWIFALYNFFILSYGNVQAQLRPLVNNYVNSYVTQIISGAGYSDFQSNEAGYIGLFQSAIYTNVEGIYDPSQIVDLTVYPLVSNSASIIPSTAQNLSLSYYIVVDGSEFSYISLANNIAQVTAPTGSFTSYMQQYAMQYGALALSSAISNTATVVDSSPPNPSSSPAMYPSASPVFPPTVAPTGYQWITAYVSQDIVGVTFAEYSSNEAGYISTFLLAIYYSNAVLESPDNIVDLQVISWNATANITLLYYLNMYSIDLTYNDLAAATQRATSTDGYFTYYMEGYAYYFGAPDLETAVSTMARVSPGSLASPSSSPVLYPSARPVADPTESPTANPTTAYPTAAPEANPSAKPTIVPSSAKPSSKPSRSPTPAFVSSILVNQYIYGGSYSEYEEDEGKYTTVFVKTIEACLVTYAFSYTFAVQSFAVLSDTDPSNPSSDSQLSLCYTIVGADVTVSVLVDSLVNCTTGSQAGFSSLSSWDDFMHTFASVEGVAALESTNVYTSDVSAMSSPTNAPSKAPASRPTARPSSASPTTIAPTNVYIMSVTSSDGSSGFNDGYIAFVSLFVIIVFAIIGYLICSALPKKRPRSLPRRQTASSGGIEMNPWGTDLVNSSFDEEDLPESSSSTIAAAFAMFNARDRASKRKGSWTGNIDLEAIQWTPPFSAGEAKDQSRRPSLKTTENPLRRGSSARDGGFKTTVNPMRRGSADGTRKVPVESINEADATLATTIAPFAASSPSDNTERADADDDFSSST